MRKQDYAFLALLIKAKIDALRLAEGNAKTEEQAHKYHFARTELHELALDFCQRASVDKSAFLKACGL